MSLAISSLDKLSTHQSIVQLSEEPAGMGNVFIVRVNLSQKLFSSSLTFQQKKS
jgi:hypothetical protein